MAHVCRLLGISRSGFYEANKRAEVPASICPLVLQLKASFAASGGCYGSRPLRKAMRAKGMDIGLYKIRRLMRTNGLHSAWKRKFVHTTVNWSSNLDRLRFHAANFSLATGDR